MRGDFRKEVLDNGVTILHEQRNVPVVSVGVGVRVGAIHEKISEKGIYHFIEHMIFKGTKKRSAYGISSAVERVGGELNAYTSEEFTTFFSKISSEKVDIALEILGDVLNNSVFKEKEFEKERKVIFEEIKMYKDNPLLYVNEGIMKCLFGGTLSKSIAGSEETLNKLNRKSVLKRYQEIYKGQNLILCAVGDVDFEKLRRFAKKTFKGNSKKVPVATFLEKNGKEIEFREGVDQVNLVFAYHVPNFLRKGLASVLLNELMTEGMSSRLFREIREKRNLAYSINGEVSRSKHFCYYQIYVAMKRENLEKVKELLLKEFSSLVENLSEKELLRIKEQIIGRHKLKCESSLHQMMNLIHSEVEEDAVRFYDFEKRVLEVKLEEVKKVARIKDYSSFTLLPK